MCSAALLLEIYTGTRKVIKMVFKLGVKTLPDIIDEIADGLIASVDSVDGLNHWSNADPTWSTAARTAINARRALKYTNGLEVMYLALESRNDWYSPYSGHTAKGLRVTFSASWDGVNHTYPTANQQTSIPFEDFSGGMPSPPSDLAALNVYYYLWVESNGFVIMAKPEPSTSNSQNSFFLVVERNPNREYADGYSNFYCFNLMNMWPTFAQAGEPNRHYSMLRPFAYKWPETNTQEKPFYYCMASGTFERYYSFLSPADRKVYYRKPLISNNKIEPGQVNTAMAPIFTAELWFPWNEEIGLIDGDIVQIEGTTKKFLLKSMDSPDSISRLIYAIKYSE